jgi:hypothetical protein
MDSPRFVAAEAFEGAKEGYIFKKGQQQGLGYHRDDGASRLLEAERCFDGYDLDAEEADAGGGVCGTKEVTVVKVVPQRMEGGKEQQLVLLLAEAQRKLLATPNDAIIQAEFDSYTRELAHFERAHCAPAPSMQAASAVVAVGLLYTLFVSLLDCCTHCLCRCWMKQRKYTDEAKKFHQRARERNASELKGCTRAAISTQGGNGETAGRNGDGDRDHELRRIVLVSEDLDVPLLHAATRKAGSDTERVAPVSILCWSCRRRSSVQDNFCSECGCARASSGREQIQTAFRPLSWMQQAIRYGISSVD